MTRNGCGRNLPSPFEGSAVKIDLRDHYQILCATILENERNWKENKGIHIPVCSEEEEVEHTLLR